MTDRSAVDQDEERGGFDTLGSAMRLLVVAWAAVIASSPLDDNSFFTHLATGRIILDESSVPSSDPYTFAAQGVDWTVQSWFASVAYAAAERLAGGAGLRVLVLAVFAAAGLLLWRLSLRAESIFARLAIVFAALFVFTGLWSERPLMIGVIGLGIVWLALDGAVRPVLLVPLLWVWGNSHGSFPLAFVLILAVIVGEILDQRRGDEGGDSLLRDRLPTELSVLKFTALGTALTVIGPLGFDALLFPLKAFTRSDLLSEIIEWQPPAYRSPAERVFLLVVLVTIVALARNGRWRLALPAVVFIGAALYAQRNVVMATMVLVPILSECAPSVGTLTARSRPGLGAAFTGICASAAVLAAIVAITSPVTSFTRYPAAALSWLEGSGAVSDDDRLATPDRSGNLLEVLEGPEGTVFVDDRADMFPAEFFADYLVLHRGGARWSSVLDEYAIDLVLWERSKPLSSTLAVAAGWRTVYSDNDWSVFCRRGQTVCDDLTS